MITLLRRFFSALRRAPDALAIMNASVVAHLPPNRYAAAVLAVMVSEIGNGEEGGNNRGPDVERYRRGGAGGAWCAALGSYAIEEGAERIGAPCPIERSHGARKLFRRCCRAGRKLKRGELPRPGDVVAWWRVSLRGWQGHFGVVKRVDAETGRYWAVEGNVGRAPAKTRVFKHRLSRLRDVRRLGFARLPAAG